jgi:hypothetical protein
MTFDRVDWDRIGKDAGLGLMEGGEDEIHTG